MSNFIHNIEAETCLNKCTNYFGLKQRNLSIINERENMSMRKGTGPNFLTPIRGENINIKNIQLKIS